MKTLAFSPAAVADLDGIWTYTATHWNDDQADRYTDTIRDARHDLAAGTKPGRPTNVRPGYRKQPVGAHVIYYRDRVSRIDVIRILHARMDVDRHL